MIRGALALVVASYSLGCSVSNSIPLGSPDAGPAVCPQIFSACGGDPTGTWKLVDFCGTQAAPNVCATASTAISFTGTETTSFDAGSMVTSKMDTYIYTTDASSCLGPDTCDTIAQRTPSQTCAPSGTSACVCTMSIPVTSNSTYTYTVSGNVLTYSQPGISGSYVVEFCVQGDVMFVALPAISSVVDMYVRQ